MGTGSGVAAIAAARAGAGQVVAVDLNPAAVACAAGNARRYGLQSRVDVRAGDLFAPVAGERFELIICNPPYFRGTPRTLADAAFLGGPQYEWLDRFAAEAGAHLAPGGRILVVLGDAADVPAILARLAAPGWRIAEVARRDLWMEMLYIYALTPRPEADGMSRAGAALVVIVLVGLAIRLYGLTSYGIWFDESYHIALVQLPGVGAMLDAVLANPPSDPLYVLLLRPWVALFGHGDGAVRALSVGLSTATLPATYWLGRMVAGPGAGSARRRAARLLALRGGTRPGGGAVRAGRADDDRWPWRPAGTGGAPGRARAAISPWASWQSTATTSSRRSWRGLRCWRCCRARGRARCRGRAWLTGHAVIGAAWLPWLGAACHPLAAERRAPRHPATSAPPWPRCAMR